MKGKARRAALAILGAGVWAMADAAPRVLPQFSSVRAAAMGKRVSFAPRVVQVSPLGRVVQSVSRFKEGEQGPAIRFGHLLAPLTEYQDPNVLDTRQFLFGTLVPDIINGIRETYGPSISQALSQVDLQQLPEVVSQLGETYGPQIEQFAQTYGPQISQGLYQFSETYGPQISQTIAQFGQTYGPQIVRGAAQRWQQMSIAQQAALILQLENLAEPLLVQMAQGQGQALALPIQRPLTGQPVTINSRRLARLVLRVEPLINPVLGIAARRAP